MMKIKEILNQEAALVNKALMVKLEEFKEYPLLDEAVDYAVMSSGKRIRPVLFKKTLDLINPNLIIDEAILNSLMVSIELVHCYSLVHDDLPAMDNSDTRRGKPTVHKKYNEAIAVLTGDALLNCAAEIMIEAIKSGNTRIRNAALALFSNSGVHGMIKGQALDLDDKAPISKERLKDLTDFKTCALIRAAMLMAASLVNANKKTTDMICELGTAIGMLFQIQDDILDIDEDTKEGKLSYATFYGLDKCEEIKAEYKFSALDLVSKINSKDMFFKEFIDFLTTRKK